MTIVLGYWIIPAVITAALWLWTFLTPSEPASGYFYFPDLMPLFRAALALVGTLASWLVYFIILSLHH